MTLDRNIVGRIGDRHVRPPARHQQTPGAGITGIATDEPVLAKQPEILPPGDGWPIDFRELDFIGRIACGLPLF